MLEHSAKLCVRWGFVALMFALSVPRAAFAEGSDYQIALLDVESDDVPDPFAIELTGRMRSALGAREGYGLHDTHVSLLQLSLAQNCNPAEAECLAAIARTLEVDGFLFGKVTHEGGAPVVLLRRYDLRSESVDRTSLVTFASRSVGSDAIDQGVDHLLSELLNAPKPSATKVEPRAAPLPPPSAAVKSSAARSDSNSVQSTFAYALITAAVLSAGMTAVSFIEVDEAEHDSNFRRYRFAVGDNAPNDKDVCTEADAGHSYGLDAASFRQAKSSCRLGKTFEVLQFVFLGAAIVTGSVGAVLLATDDSGERPDVALRSGWKVRPNLGVHSAGVDARLSF
ncbi:MAG TPA: hypothetical protein VGI70_21095 [Polyangiales bacterium]|jgi:hypothetical protein